MRGPKGGTCPHCHKETGALIVHMRSCTPPDEILIERSAAHVRPAEMVLRGPQRFQHGVTDLDVARVMYALESGARLYLSRLGRWCAPTGSRLQNARTSPAVHEMIRTGLVRHWRDRNGDHLVPARIHLDAGDHQSACHFIGEDMGPMRSRLTKEVTLVDCPDCVSTAIVRV